MSYGPQRNPVHRATTLSAHDTPPIMPLPFVSSRLRVVSAAVALLVSAALTGCNLKTTEPLATDPATQSYASVTGVNIATMTRVNSQLYTQDLTVGTGRTVIQTDSLGVYYNGRLTGGFQFDARALPSTPFLFTLDTVRLVSGIRTPGVISGWVQGIAGMKVGGKRKLVIGPQLGYGFNRVNDPSGLALIPANSVLVFDVEVISSVPKTSGS
jgi:FKBP-type peptidyl-prolyl cis-trans isomerase FkpA